MTTLLEKMAANGYESNDDYSYHIKCLLNSRSDDIHCLNIEGAPGRRKTAFANALATSLEYQHVLYHDFSDEQPIPPTPPAVSDDDGEPLTTPTPVSAFDHVMSDACAFSEGEQTVVILDQLQAAQFARHIQLYQFIRSGEWHSSDTQFFANRDKLLMFLISEEPLYHSLQKHSFRVWVNATSMSSQPYRAEDFDLATDIQAVINALHALFSKIGVMPTLSEFARILHDIQHNVRTDEELIHSIYGWSEGITQEVLHAREVGAEISRTMLTIEAYLGVDEVELSADNFVVHG